MNPEALDVFKQGVTALARYVATHGSTGKDAKHLAWYLLAMCGQDRPITTMPRVEALARCLGECNDAIRQLELFAVKSSKQTAAG